MNILILCTKVPWPAKDGGAIATLNLALGLADSGCRVTFLAMNTPKHHSPMQGIPSGIRERINLAAVDVNTAIRPVHLLFNFLFSSYPYIAKRFISRNFRLKMEECLMDMQYDIVQLEGPYLAWYIPFIRRRSSAKISLRAHNLEHRIWEQTAGRETGPVRRIYLKNMAKRIRRLETITLTQLDLLVPISRADEPDFNAISAEMPVLVCPAGLDVSSYPVNDQLDRIKLFFIGALDWSPNQAGLDWFFRGIWPAVLRERPELTLSLAGRNSSGYFARRTVPPNISLRGELEDATGFFREHNVLIVPLLSGSGIRIKILEAMAMGKIVISTSAGAEGLGVEAGRHLFIADTPDDFIRAILHLSDHLTEMKDMGINARKFVTENFDNFAITKRLISFYKEQMRCSGK